MSLTDEDLSQLCAVVADAMTDAIQELILPRFDEHDKRLDALDRRFDVLEASFIRIEAGITPPVANR